MRRDSHAGVSVVASALMCYLHNSPTFCAKLATVPSYYTCTLKYNVQQLINAPTFTTFHADLIEDALDSTKGLTGGIDEFEEFPKAFSSFQPKFAFAYIYTNWFISIWFAARAQKIPIRYAVLPSIQYGSISYSAWCIANYPLAQLYKKTEHWILDPARQTSMVDKFYLLQLLLVGKVVQQLAMAYYFRFSYLPTALQIQSTKNLMNVKIQYI